MVAGGDILAGAGSPRWLFELVKPGGHSWVRLPDTRLIVRTQGTMDKMDQRKKEEMDNRQGLGFILGCAVGAGVTAFLLTSKPGRESVRYVRGKADEGARFVKDRAGDIRDAVTNGVAGGIKTVRHQTENLDAAVDAGMQAFRDAEQATP